MFRQASSRNHRNKGFKVKHVLQICLLLAVCIWLLYQVKHSHDKKKAFDENNAKYANQIENGLETLKLGRKDLNDDLNQRFQISSENDDKHGDEEENEEEESKQEEKVDEIEEERGGGDDEIDEQDQEKVDEEAEREEYSADEGKEAKEKEAEVKEDENYGETEDVDSSENHDRDLNDKNTQEAREEHYKGDDPARAVVRDSQMITSEVDKDGLRNSGEEHADEGAEKLEDINQTISIKDHTVDKSDLNSTGGGPPVFTVDEKVRVNNASVNVTSDGKGVEFSESKAQNESFANLTTTETLNQTAVPNNETTVDSARTSDSDLKNETTIVGSVSDQNSTVKMGTSDQNTQMEKVGLENKDNTSSSKLAEELHTDTAEQNGNTNTTSELDQTFEAEKTITNSGNTNTTSEVDRTFEASKTITTSVGESGDNEASSFTTGEANAELVENETTDSSISMVTEEVKDNLTDLGTLPHIENEGRYIEDSASE